MTSPHNGTGPAPHGAGPVRFWDELVREAVGVYTFELDDGDGSVEFTVEHPSSAAVAELDEAVSDLDVLYLLLPEDEADEAADLLEDEPVSVTQELVDDIRAHFGILVPTRYGWRQLVEDLNKYGSALERDLLPFGQDLYPYVRDHENTPWSKLYRFMDRPVEGGWYEAARLDDDELALEQVKAEKKGDASAKPARRPPIVGWTRDRETFESMLELLERIDHGIWGASPKFKGKGGKRPGRHPRPETAYNRAKRFALYVEHDEISAQLLGSRYTPKFTTSPWDDDQDEQD